MVHESLRGRTNLSQEMFIYDSGVKEARAGGGEDARQHSYHHRLFVKLCDVKKSTSSSSSSRGWRGCGAQMSSWMVVESVAGDA